jgi:hypothetical protein
MIISKEYVGFYKMICIIMGYCLIETVIVLLRWSRKIEEFFAKKNRTGSQPPVRYNLIDYNISNHWTITVFIWMSMTD